jgi:two-component system chemotaxis sensor kinase CheA
MRMIDKSKYMDMFVEEAQEHLQILNSVLLDLENKGYDKEQMNAAYRTVHTIKGSASVLGIDIIGDLAHTMEDLFDLLREREEILDDDMLDILFKSSDLIETMIHEISKKGSVKTKGEKIIEEIKGLMKTVDGSKVTPKGPKKGKKVKKTKRNEKQVLSFNLTEDQKNQVMEALAQGLGVYEIDVDLDENERFKEGRVFQLIRELSENGYVIASTPDTKEIHNETAQVKILMTTKNSLKDLTKILKNASGVENHSVTPLDSTNADYIIKKGNGEKDNDKTSNAKQQAGITKSETIRVKSKLLDQLLDLVGEIMINNIRVKQIAIDLKHRELKQVLKNAERLIEELQDTVLRMRMVPVDHIFKRFPRMVRDMAKEEGKEINFEIMGNDIEIDRSLLDEIGDSLVHLLRNAVDHGIESENDRRSRGKKPRGDLKLHAFREQSNIVITVEDDGKGINTKKLIEKATNSGVLTQEEADKMEEKDALSLAFQPGISTAMKITEISGRGVGLDVVKSKIEELGGTVRLESEEWGGTKFTMKLPPSMSIISAMLVEINGENYAIPLENVSETTKISHEEIHEFAKSGMFRLREEILPLLNVHKEFGGNLEGFDKEMPVIIVEKDDDRSGLIITKFIGQQEIVVKNLTKDLRQAQYFSGATILGDGNVALILDVGTFM